MNTVAYEDQLCTRCGSKRRISRRWKEKIPTFSGDMYVEYEQVVCTNKECQRLFDENLAKEEAKKKIVTQQKEEREKERKSKLLLKTKKINKK